MTWLMSKINYRHGGDALNRPWLRPAGTVVLARAPLPEALAAEQRSQAEAAAKAVGAQQSDGHGCS